MIAQSATKTTELPRTKVRTKVQRPPFWKVILLNDDYTPREFVVGLGRTIRLKDCAHVRLEPDSPAVLQPQDVQPLLVEALNVCWHPHFPDEPARALFTTRGFQEEARLSDWLLSGKAARNEGRDPGLRAGPLQETPSLEELRPRLPDALS